jgi:hypothetical protein
VAPGFTVSGAFLYLELYFNMKERFEQGLEKETETVQGNKKN